MSGGDGSQSLPVLASDRLAMLGRLMRAGEPAGVSRSAWSLWWLLAVGYSNAAEGGRCRVSRAVVMERLGLKASATAAAYRALIVSGWLERRGRAYPGRVAEYRVVVPASVCARLAGGDRVKRARRGGGKGPAGRRNGSAGPAAEQKGLTEQQQQQGAAAAGVVRDEQGKAAPAVEHPKVAAVLDRVGLVDRAARAEVAGVDGIERVIEELGERAAKGDNPAGLLRVLARDEAPALIVKAREAEAVIAKRKAAASAKREQSAGEAKRRQQAEQALEAMSEADRAALREAVLAGVPKPSGKLSVPMTEGAVRGWMVEELIQRQGVADKTSTRG